MEDKQWSYNGYELEIWHDYEDDNIKAFHEYKKRGNQSMELAHITPYDSSYATVELFIDAIEAGADPKGQGFEAQLKSNWTRETLIRFMYERLNLGG